MNPSRPPPCRRRPARSSGCCDVSPATQPAAARRRNALMSSPAPRLDITGPAADARAVVLLLHGGEVHSLIRSRRGLGYARMVPFGWAIARASRGRRGALWLLRSRYRGWKEPDRQPVQDARWALDEARRRHPGAPIVL